MLLSGGGPGEKDEKRALVGAESRPNDLSCTFLFRKTLANASRRAFVTLCARTAFSSFVFSCSGMWPPNRVQPLY